MAPGPGTSVFLERVVSMKAPTHPPWGPQKQSRALKAQPREWLALGSAVGQSHHGLQCRLSSSLLTIFNPTLGGPSGPQTTQTPRDLTRPSPLPFPSAPWPH